ncbi:MAG: hypothetical protein GXO40_06785 [Epsilonproteobacteria bacterium]|nr:hypothetical protein [Campylobacterota bacterium]
MRLIVVLLIGSVLFAGCFKVHDTDNDENITSKYASKQFTLDIELLNSNGCSNIQNISYDLCDVNGSKITHTRQLSNIQQHNNVDFNITDCYRNVFVHITYNNHEENSTQHFAITPKRFVIQLSKTNPYQYQKTYFTIKALADDDTVTTRYSCQPTDLNITSLNSNNIPQDIAYSFAISQGEGAGYIIFKQAGSQTLHITDANFAKIDTDDNPPREISGVVDVDVQSMIPEDGSISLPRIHPNTNLNFHKVRW